MAPYLLSEFLVRFLAEVFVEGVCMFSTCMHGFSLNTPVSPGAQNHALIDATDKCRFFLTVSMSVNVDGPCYENNPWLHGNLT